jgi:hypothetical protein
VLCTDVDVHFVTDTTTAPFTVQIDADAPVVMGGMTAQATYGVMNVVASAGHGFHSIKVIAPAVGNVIFWGIAANDGAGGCRVHRVAQSGATAASCGTGGGTPWLTMLAPQLTVISFGTNEYQLQQSIASYTAALTQLITAAQSVGSLVLLMSECPDQNVFTIPQASYVAAMQALAALEGVYYLDIYNRAGWGGSWATANASGFMTNPIHPTDLGHADMATALQAVLF